MALGEVSREWPGRYPDWLLRATGARRLAPIGDDDYRLAIGLEAAKRSDWAEGLFLAGARCVKGTTIGCAQWPRSRKG
jgi:hypothetical protein